MKYEKKFGKDLVGLAYEPLFDYFVDQVSEQAYHVIASTHVTTGDGTGLVHMAPDFGEDDFNACKAKGIQVLQSVDDGGNLWQVFVILQDKISKRRILQSFEI